MTPSFEVDEGGGGGGGGCSQRPPSILWFGTVEEMLPKSNSFHFNIEA